VLVGLRKSLPNVTVFFSEFQLQFDIFHLSLSDVSLLPVYLFILYVCLLPFIVNKDVICGLMKIEKCR